MDKIRVLIIDDVAETRENLRKLLSFEPDIDVIGAAGSGSEGIELAGEYEPNVVLMDINMPGMDGITATEKLLQTVPTAQVVMLSVQGETDYLRRAMLAGARDYLTKPASADELVNTIQRVFEMGKTQPAAAGTGKADATTGSSEEEQERRERAKTIVFFSPKGGTGCTTVAVNTAIALQEQAAEERRVALLDGDLQFGDVGVMLNLRPDRSVADLADRIDELDRDLLSSVMTAHGSGIKVLLAPPRPEAAESLLSDSVTENGERAVAAVVDKMRDGFDIIVADTWSWMDDVTLTLFDRASLIVLVITPDIPAVKSARLFVELADKLDYAMENIALVVNGAGRRGSLQPGQIENAIMPVAMEIPFDERSALTAANRGVPVIMRERNRPISKGVFELADMIRGRLMEKDEEDEATGQTEARGSKGAGLFRLKEAFDRG
jgi:pilus assembly protein CpaE